MIEMKAKAPFTDLYIYLLLGLSAYMTADLGILYFRDQMIPNNPPPKAPMNRRMNPNMFDNSNFMAITQKNIFNSDGKIPDALGADGVNQQKDAPPVLTSLPLALVGTLVHADPERSMATINLKSKNENHSFAVDDEIKDMAKIVKVERNKCIFRNLMTGRLEYVEIKQDSKINFGVSKPVAKTDGPVTVLSDTDRELMRKDVDDITSNLPQVLQQARAVPRFKGGMIDGFTLLDLQKGSIYDKLGLKPNDVIKGVNGETIDSANKALELYNALKQSAQIRLEIERDGKAEVLNYTIR